MALATEQQQRTTKTYSFGVVPQFDARQTHAIWRPILDILEEKTGYHFHMTGSRNIPDFESQFMSGVFDFAYMNPYHIIKAYEKQGYEPLVRDVEHELQGIIVVRKDSDINNVSQLNGKRVAFPSPNALGATLLTRAAFANDFNISVIPKFVKSHSSVYIHLALGRVAAGGGVVKSLQQQKPEIRDALRILYKTKKVAPHPVTAHERIPENIQLHVKQAFLSLGTSDDGRTLLSKVPIKKIGSANIDHYRPLKEMGLERFAEGL